MTDPGLVYPAPSLVVGLGRFGLAVLERLGEDWQQLRLSGGDRSLENLRLLWLHGEDDKDISWRTPELKELAVAHFIDDGDLPSLVLDFVLLRTLGLIRYHHGVYQVAVPQDRGPIRESDFPLEREKAEEDGAADGAAGSRETHEADHEQEGGASDSQFRRRRFFEWWDLGPDPIEAADELRRQVERRGSLDLFVAPILHRVRQGHSPWVLLSCILRLERLEEGRDPSPWRWVRDALEASPTASDRGSMAISREKIQKICRGHRLQDRLLWRLAPLPLRPNKNFEKLSKAGKVLDWAYEEDQIDLPDLFVPRGDDPEAPIDPFHLLGENWQNTGWATETSAQAVDRFKPLEVSHFRLGLFDHSSPRQVGAGTFREALQARLRALGRYCRKGLVRLYVDLNREQVEERSAWPQLLRRESLDEARLQSLTFLEKLLVSPVEGGEQRRDQAKACAGSLEFELEELPSRSTRFLESLTLDPDARRLEESALERRLTSLGLSDPSKPRSSEVRLMRSVLYRRSGAEVEDSDPGTPCRPETAEAPKAEPQEGREPEAATPEREGPCGDPQPDAMPRFRKILNEEVRRLFDFGFLAAYRKRPTRSAPRLTVLVVGDMSEPFTRSKMTDALRDIHSELLRAFSSMFELHREGFDRALSVIPILWMAHPADPFGGEASEKTRLEEAVIIEAVHEVRRWVESVLPGARRRISQIFVNGRVTDNAVLRVADSVRQTRDFISFLVRNDLSQDDWLRRTAVGPGGDDYFASFACSEIEFPAERAKEYLANRMARDCLERLRADSEWRGREDVVLPQPESEEELIGEARSEIQRMTRAEAETLAGEVWNAVSKGKAVPRCIPRKEVDAAFDEAFEHRLWSKVQDLWARLTQRRGRMDDLVDRSRHLTSRKLRGALPEIRRHSDDDIQQVSAFGLPAALSRLEDRRRAGFEQLQDFESQRREMEGHCQRHDIPVRGLLTSARESVLRAAAAKPDCEPQRPGLVAWTLLTPVTAAFLATLMAPWLGLWSLPATAVVLVFGAWGALWKWTSSRHRRLTGAIRGLERTVRSLLAGSGEEPIEGQATSLRSFLEMRVLLTSTLARRGYALHVFEQTAVDEALGQRLRESLDVQEHHMIRRAERLGVRPAPPGSDERDDLRRLFVRRAGGRMEQLIDSAHLEEYYRHRVRPEELPVADFLETAGGVSDWRKHACLSDETTVMGYGREFFARIAAEPITQLDYFAEAVGRHLLEFVGRCYSNLGFGAKFIGYEGLDPDGVRLVADAALVADAPMLQAFARAEEKADRPGRPSTQMVRRSRTLDRIPCKVRPNAAYMLSLVQGVRAHSVHNLKRFESFHDREARPKEDGVPVHLLTGIEPSLGIELEAARSPGTQLGGPGPAADQPAVAEKRPSTDVPAGSAE